jgi:hypothetical protein
MRYGDREVIVGELSPDTDPALVDLCREHAERLTPPIGWRIVWQTLPERVGAWGRRSASPGPRGARAGGGSARRRLGLLPA